MSQKKMQMCKHFSSQPEKKTLDTGRLWQSCSVLLHHSWFWGVSDSTRIYPYLESTETKKLFKPVDDEMDVLNAINNQMEWLPTIIDDCKGYWCLVSVLEKDDDCTSEVHGLCSKPIIILFTLSCKGNDVNQPKLGHVSPKSSAAYVVVWSEGLVCKN
jgi:hypothetical protein